MKIIKRSSLAFFLIISSAAAAEEGKVYKASSTLHPVALVELYTSQGCSSCPPADKWLLNLENSGMTPDKIIPLALHVDYWDYIGWKDQFAQASFAKRQRQFRTLNRSSSVYTPQIILNGEDVRKIRFNTNINQLKKEKSPVHYELVAKKNINKKLQVNINFSRIDHKAKKSHLIVALAENKLQGIISSGENTGKVLHHGHVVRRWRNVGILKKNMILTIEIDKSWQQKNLELIAFVETPNLRIQQALRLALK